MVLFVLLSLFLLLLSFAPRHYMQPDQCRQEEAQPQPDGFRQRCLHSANSRTSSLFYPGSSVPAQLKSQIKSRPRLRIMTTGQLIVLLDSVRFVLIYNLIDKYKVIESQTLLELGNSQSWI